MTREKKRICLALSNVGAEDAIMKRISSNFSNRYEVVENVRSKEGLISALNKEKFDVLILREELTGNIDLIDLFKMIRQGNEDLQIIFFMNSRENGDPFFIEMFLFNIYDFVVLPNISLDDVFGFLNKPRKFKDIIRFLPTRAERIHNLIVQANNNMKLPPKLAEDGDIDEVFTVNINKPRPTPVPVPRPTPAPVMPERKPMPTPAPIAKPETVQPPVSTEEKNKNESSANLTMQINLPQSAKPKEIGIDNSMVEEDDDA